MSRRKITDGLHQRADGRWERKEKINGKMHWFSSMNPAEVWKKRDAAVATGPEEKAKQDAEPIFDTYADKYEESVESPKWSGEMNAAAEAKMPRGLKRGKRQPPTDNQVKIVKDHYLDPDALPAVVYLYTGERRGEACGIILSDIDFEAGIIHIRRHIEHIGNKPHILDGAKTEAGVRDIPLLKMLRDAIEPLRGMAPGTYILGGGSIPLTASQYKHKWVGFWSKHGCVHQKEHTYHYKNRFGVICEYHHTEFVADVCAH